ncbi:hypothetical protein PV325_012466 [Microctonus aethiopoides]|nr:hypothetical protein PV325_012466 [Microctonus aethiopoides]
MRIAGVGRETEDDAGRHFWITSKVDLMRVKCDKRKAVEIVLLRDIARVSVAVIKVNNLINWASDSKRD